MNTVEYEEFLTAYLAWVNTKFSDIDFIHSEGNVKRKNAWNFYVCIRDKYLKSIEQASIAMCH